MKSYTLSEMLRILSVDRGRANEWISRGLIDSEISCKKGSRIHKEYSLIDLYAIGIFKSLVEKTNMTRENASAISKLWRTLELSEKMVIRTDDIFIAISEKEFVKEFVILMDPEINDGKITWGAYMTLDKKLVVSQSSRFDWDSVFILNRKKVFREIDLQI